MYVFYDLFVHRTPHGKPDTLSEKQFTNAESLLTELFETTHIKTLHNIFIVGLILILINGTISDSVEPNGTLVIKLKLLKRNKQKMHATNYFLKFTIIVLLLQCLFWS